MILEIHEPSYPLNQFIESFTYYRDYQPLHTVDRFLPDGNINMIIDLTDYPKFIYDNHTLKEIQSCRNVWFSGIRNHFITIPSGRDSEMFVINFQKGRAYPFVEMPMHELTDYVVDGELVMSNDILVMREKLLMLPLPIEKFLYVEKFLMKKFSKKMQVNPFSDFAVKQILETPQNLTIEKIATKTGYSQKHFIKIFKEHVGLTPKAFLKVIRFQKAIAEIEMKKSFRWASVALESGYYDQAHFINDFKLFSGYTPSEYLKMKKSFTNYIALD